MELTVHKEFKFSASHILPRHKGKCSNLHGHNWKLRVFVTGKVDKETGFVIDYADINKAVEPIIEAIDHKHLGQWISDGSILQQSIPTNLEFVAGSCKTSHAVINLPNDFYPSSENLIVWIGDQLLNHSLGVSLGWSKLELDETDTVCCALTREEYDKIR